MRNPIKYSIFMILAVGTMANFSYAQIPASDSEIVAESTPIQELPLTERKVKADNDLRALHAQLSLFTTRTQVAIDRLSVKDVKTLTAQNELNLSISSLLLAKENLDLLSLSQISDDATEKEVAELKILLKNIEDNLKMARAQLIESLTSLKTAVSIRIDAQTQ